jgi:superfamily II DNA/RNA helicase
MDHKHAVFLACLLEQKDDPSPSWLEWTAEDLDVKASSRILQLCYLVEHYKDPNAQPLFFKRDGSRDLEKEAEHKGPPAKRPRKVLVFIMYDLHRQIASIVSEDLCSEAEIDIDVGVGQALTLKGLKCLEYDGKMSLAARQQAVDRFERDDEVRVMLISNVGTTGLNLTMASVVIFVVSCPSMNT